MSEYQYYEFQAIDRALTRAQQERLAEYSTRAEITSTRFARRANVDAVVRRALTGHVTEEMQRRYSTVQLDEKRAAIAGVIKLVRPSVVGAVETKRASASEVGTTVGTEPERQKAG